MTGGCVAVAAAGRQPRDLCRNGRDHGVAMERPRGSRGLVGRGMTALVDALAMDEAAGTAERASSSRMCYRKGRRTVAVVDANGNGRRATEGAFSWTRLRDGVGPP